MALADPTVRSQELGEQLSALRAAAGCSLTTAGQRIDASASKICRIENGHTTATPEDVAALLVVYGVTGPHRSELLNLAREAEKRGWWQRYQPEQPAYGRTLLTQESKASSIVTFDTILIPGLLQTSEYTRALMQDCGSVPEEELARHINFRKERQSLLTRRDAPYFVAVIYEPALHSPFGGQGVLQQQLTHLLHMGRRANISVLVVPNDGRVHAGIDGPFMLIRKTGRQSVAFTENMTSCLFIEEPAEVAQYASAIQQLSDQAWDEEQSAKLIANLAQTDERNELRDGQDLDPQQLQQRHEVHLR